MKYLRHAFIIAIFLIPALIFGQDFKKYQIKRNDIAFMEIVTDQQVVELRFIDDSPAELKFRAEDAVVTGDGISIYGQEYFTRDGISRTGKIVPYSSISRVEVVEGESGGLEITFYRKDPGSGTGSKIPSGNYIGSLDKMIIGENDFVRGSVVNFWGEIEIRHGEVGGNVISLFGNITVGEKGVVRKNVVAVNGGIDLNKEATIYGMISSSDFEQRSRTHKWDRWYRTGKYFSPIAKFCYNRVDGAAPYAGVKFLDEDSVLPEIRAYGGYGFASEEPRYHFGIEKHFEYKGIGFTFGGKLYRRLASDDDWLISETENTIFALLATEDYKDYYDAEGGYVGLEVRPYKSLRLNIGFRNERIRMLDASRNLWSLFGGSKRFPKNYKGINRLSEVDSGLFEELDGTRMKTLILALEAGRKGTAYSNESFSKIFAEFETAPKSWNDEATFPTMDYYDYSRFRTEAVRYQKVTRNTGVLMRGLFGFSGEDLPLTRQFYLGGLTTLKGYDEKEYGGSDFWMVDFDYRIKFSRFNFTGWLFYNAGQIAGGGEDIGDQELKQSIGAGITVFDFVRFDVALRLDRGDESPVIYGRLDRWF